MGRERFVPCVFPLSRAPDGSPSGIPPSPVSRVLDLAIASALLPWKMRVFLLLLALGESMGSGWVLQLTSLHPSPARTLGCSSGAVGLRSDSPK